MTTKKFKSLSPQTGHSAFVLNFLRATVVALLVGMVAPLALATNANQQRPEALDPQPIPPSQPDKAKSQLGEKSLSLVGKKPGPRSPGDPAPHATSAAATRALDPQPIPPGAGAKTAAPDKARTKALVPKKPPIDPPPVKP